MYETIQTGHSRHEVVCCKAAVACKMQRVHADLSCIKSMCFFVPKASIDIPKLMSVTIVLRRLALTERSSHQLQQTGPAD